MQVVTPSAVQGKKVLLRLDIDVPLGVSEDQSISGSKMMVRDDFRLKVALPTIKLCLEHASEVIIMGHIGRPGGKVVPDLSVGPIVDWLEQALGDYYFADETIHVLENLRFEKGEEECDLGYTQELAKLGDVFINEAFAAYHEAASTTILPTLLPHFAGLRFAQEVEILKKVRENPKRPLVVIIGGAKVEDKLPVVSAMSKIANYVLVGGKLASEMQSTNLSQNVLMAALNEEGIDSTPESISAWEKIIQEAKVIVWNGPVGKIEGEGKSEKGTYELAQVIINSRAETIVGGGDTVGFLKKVGLLDEFSFVSTGGGAMLKFLETGTLPTIEALT